MATPSRPHVSYSLYMPLDDGLSLVRRTTDGELLLARPLDNNNNDKLTELIRHGAAQPAAQLLNHENLISIHDELVHTPLNYDNNNTDLSSTILGAAVDSETKTQRMLLWDYPDAGTLQDILTDYSPETNGFDPVEVGGFLPESFIWHVTLGLLRALQWLHEGVRDTYACGRSLSSSFPSSSSDEGEDLFSFSAHRQQQQQKRYTRVRGTEKVKGDWWPVLHRDLKAGNVFLQQPRGSETYGAVKLGRFERCYVSGATREGPVVAMEVEDRVGVYGFRQLLGRWQRKGLEVAQAERPYTNGSELFAVGALLYHMMVGRELPPAEECPYCGCVHLTSNDAADLGPCEHDCAGDVNIDEVFQPLFNYTENLKGLASLLLRLNRTVDRSASSVLDTAWEGFKVWADNTEDGRMYRDIFDDMWLRQQNLARLKKKQREAEKEEAMHIDSDVLVF